MLGFNARVGAIHTKLMTGIVYHAPAEKARENGESPGLFNNLSILKIRHKAGIWHTGMILINIKIKKS